MSIFSGWSRNDLSLLWATVTGSPAGLAILFGFGLFILFVIGFVSFYVSGKVAGFFSRIQLEDEEAKREEENAAAEEKAALSNEETRNE